MKKRIWAVLLVALMCLTVFAGCGIMKGLEHDVNVTVVVEGKSYGPYTVNIFNNAVVPNPEELDPPLVVESGMRFVGWTAQQNWQELEESEVTVTSNLYLIRYNEVKDFADENGNVTLYPVVRPIVLKDLVVAWYNKPATSFLTSEIMETFEHDMLAYIESEGYDVSALDIEVRGYEGNVGASCGAIKKDGDVDIMVGWSNTNNLTGTGGMDASAILDNQQDIYINPDKEGRYAAKLHDRELANLVYQWILDTYQKVIVPTAITITPETAEIEVGKTQAFTATVTPSNAKTDMIWSVEDDTIATVDGGLVKGVAPGETTITATSKHNKNVSCSVTVTVVPAKEEEKPILKIAWYDKEGTSGLNAELMAEVESSLNEYLATKGYTTDTLTVVFKGYTGNVGPSCAEIMADGDVDIMLGWNHTITTTGEMPESMILENVSGVKINPEKERYAARLTDDDVTKLAFWWIQKTYIDGFDKPEPDAPTETVKLVIGYWNNSKSGVTETMMKTVIEAFTAYLTEQGYDESSFEIVLRPLDQSKVADVGTAVNTAGDYDILFGMGKNITSGANINVKKIGDGTEQYRINVTMSGVAERNVAIVESSQSELALVMWDWLFGTETTDAWLSSAQAQEIGFTYPEVK